SRGGRRASVEVDRRPRVNSLGSRNRTNATRCRGRPRPVAILLTVEAPFLGRPAAAGPATAQAGAAAASIVSAVAREASDSPGAAQATALEARLVRLAQEVAEAYVAALAAFPNEEPVESDAR